MEVSKDELCLQDLLHACVSRGDTTEGVLKYSDAVAEGNIHSAHTHQLFYELMRDERMSRKVARSIMVRAKKCEDYKKYELNLLRAEALFLLADNDCWAAKKQMENVEYRRKRESDQDRSQLPIDELALCEIELAVCEIDLSKGDSQSALQRMRELKNMPGLPVSAKLWIHFALRCDLVGPRLLWLPMKLKRKL